MRFLLIYTALLISCTLCAGGNFDASNITDGTFTTVKFSTEVSSSLKTTTEVETIIDDYGVNSTEVLLKDGTVPLTGDWDAGDSGTYDVTGIASLKASTVAVDVTTPVAKIQAKTTDHASVAGLFGDETAGEGDSTYITGNSVNCGYSQDTDLGGLWINYRGYQNGTTRFRDIYLGDGKGNQLVFLDGSEASLEIKDTSMDVKTTATSEDSPYFLLSADNSGTTQSYKLQACYGADPYLRMLEDGTTFLNFQDDVVYPETTNSMDLGISGTNEFKNLYLAGDAVANSFTGDGSGLTNVPTHTSDVETIIDAYSYNSTEVYTKTEADATIEAHAYDKATVDGMIRTDGEIEAVIDDYSYNSTEIYTQTELDAGQLDSLYYTETEIDALNIDDLNDVNVSSPSDNDVLTYDTASGEWTSEASSGTTSNSFETLEAEFFTSTGTIEFPTTASASEGTILQNGTRFLHSYGTQNTFLGSSAGNFSVTGSGNIAIGDSAQFSLSAGDLNIAIGDSALRQNSLGDRNIAIGQNAMYFSSDPNRSVAIGQKAGYAADGDNNIFIGHTAGEYETGSNTVIIDGQDRANESDGRTKSLIYGITAATVADQEIHFNVNTAEVDGTIVATAFEGDGSGLTGVLSNVGTSEVETIIDDYSYNSTEVYTQTELDGGQLDTIYYTETELDAGQLDTRYYTETEIDALTIDDLSDVNVSSPSDNDVLTYDTASGEWTSEASSGGTTSNSFETLEVQYDSTMDLHESLVTISNMQFMGLEDGSYFGRTGIKETGWYLSDFADSWTTTASSHDWTDSAMSSNGQIIYASAGGDGVYQSTDFGKTWTQISTNSSYGLATSADGKIVLNGASSSVYNSTDYGATWTLATDAHGGQRRAAAMSSDGKIQYGYGVSEFWKSEDFGDTWTEITSFTIGVYDIVPHLACSSDGRIVIAPFDGYKIRVSTDFGETWSWKGATADWTDAVISADGKFVAACDDDAGDIYLSSDYGATWTNSYSGFSAVSKLSMSASGQYLVATSLSTDGYAYSTDWGDNFTFVNDGVAYGGTSMSTNGMIVVGNGALAGDHLLKITYAGMGSVAPLEVDGTIVSDTVDVSSSVVIGEVADTVEATSNYGKIWVNSSNDLKYTDESGNTYTIDMTAD